MSAAVQTLLRQVRAGYLEGLGRPGPEGGGHSEAAKLQILLGENLHKRLGAAELKLITACSSAYTKGLRTARIKDLSLARRCFAEARTISESPCLSEEGRAFCLAFLGAAEAFMNYRGNNLEQARLLLCESLAAHEILEKHYDYRLSHVHRLHLVRNLVRLETQAGNLTGAFEMIGRLLCYLEGSSDEVPAPGSWGWSCRDALPPEYIAQLFTQVVEEICYALAGRTAETSRGLLAIMDNELPLPNPGVWHPLAFKWLVIKRSFVKEDTHSFLEMSTGYLCEGAGLAPTLWRHVALDVAIACSSLPFPEARELQREILEHAPRWRGMSTKLSGLVQDLAVSFACRSIIVGDTRR